MRQLLIHSAFWISLLLLTAFSGAPPFPAPPLESSNAASNAWVDSVYAAMSTRERVGQLFMIRAHSDKGPAHVAEVKRLIQQWKPGGLIFFQGTARQQAVLTNQYQELSDLPLFIAMDAEWGLGMRLEDVPNFPYQLQLGAVQDDQLVYQVGAAIGRQCQRLGVHINFAPVADINNNPDNPVIGFRSFGEDRYNVAAKSFWFAKGLLSEGVYPCAKHFPGHGDTDVDSHLDLPIIRHARQRLDSIELFPFRFLAQQRIPSMMIAHLNLPALDTTTNRPTTLSQKVVTGLLKEQLDYDGLIFTDAMEMEGVRKFFDPGVAEAEAFRAGNDVLLLPQNLGKAVEAILSYLEAGILTEDRLAHSVKKILRAKYELGLFQKPHILLDRLEEELHTPSDEALIEQVAEQAQTLLRDKNRRIPYNPVAYENMASISIGTSSSTPFQKMLSRYGDFTHYHLPKGAGLRQRQVARRNLKDKDLVVLSLHGLRNRPDYGLHPTQVSFIREVMAQHPNACLVIFGNPYLLSEFDAVDRIVMAYDDHPEIQEATAQGLFGAAPFQGKLPVTASSQSPYYAGEQRFGRERLGFVHPERVGANSRVLQSVDSLMQVAIQSKATPGAVVLGVRDGDIFFEKAYGYQTYDKKRPISPQTIYDLASITKAAATTLAVMKLYEMGRLELEAPLGRYLPELDTFDKADLQIADLLTHTARLQPWIPFYLETIEKSRRRIVPKPDIYRPEPVEDFQVPVTSRIFMHKAYMDSMRYRIWTSPLRSSREYRYSDLGFYLLTDVVERLSGTTLDEFMNQHFYAPMGLERILFSPWRKVPIEAIPPTEEDRYFRQERVQGYVHDMGAAMWGGIAGHAGLFSDAAGLAALFQMLLNGGHYGGQQYLRPETIELFTSRRLGHTRRGLGFDMKETDPLKVLNTSPSASNRTFGHLGFTGVAVWADPTQNLIFVVLTNRTFPRKESNGWGRKDYRPRLQSIFYKALQAGSKSQSQ